jgi:hypothetical protein
MLSVGKLKCMPQGVVMVCFGHIIRNLDGINAGNREIFTTVMSGVKFKQEAAIK